MNRKQRRTEKSKGGSQDVLGGLFQEAVNHHRAGRLNDAIAGYRRVLALKPDYADALNNLAGALVALGKPGEALPFYKRILTLDPGHIDTLNNIGVVLQALNQLDEARGYFERALALRPNLAEAHYNLGNILKARGMLDDAVKHFAQAAAIRPYPAAHINIGAIMLYKGLLHDAAAQYRAALALKPDSVDALNGLGVTQGNLGRFEEAGRCYERALAIKPDSPETLDNLAVVHKAYGRLDKAMACFRRALALDPARASTYNQLLLTMIYAPSVPPEELAATARAFGERAADPLRRKKPPVRNADPERKLRIGYVSPDFCNHAVNYFLEPLLTRHDRRQFEVFAYSSTVTEDAVMARLKRTFDHWRDIRFMNDDEAADLIEADAIDILVDLAGHTGGNRLLVFARKPAPVQATWLGYPATTGMKAMDYRITDVHAEPAGMTEYLNVETLWRLPEIFCCYQAHENKPDVIDHPPFEDNGYITFGCFNSFLKVTDEVLEAWARILAKVPHSRLLLEISKIDDAQFRASVEERLRRAGLPLDRVILELRRKANQYVLYNRIDIALDPFPCNGGTTSMDTVWMGVPFITLAGKHFVSRMGVTILTNAGMPELIAGSVDEYVELAAGLALDKDRLRALRHYLRDRVVQSPVMNQDVFARNMEAAYREMWRRWRDES